MVTKAFGTLLIAIACILMLPIFFGILGGVFGIIFGVIGGIFGAIFGVIGGVFGAIFGFFEWIFDGLFGWHNPFLWNINPFTVFVFVLVVALLVRASNRRQNKTP